MPQSNRGRDFVAPFGNRNDLNIEKAQPAEMNQEWNRAGYVISTDSNRLDVSLIHDFLSNSSYWAKGRSLDLVKLALENSLNFGLFKGNKQVGFARVVTDYATFAWLADVFILTEHRTRGLGKWLLEVISAHPQLQGFRRWLLATKDAHRLYRQFGFTELQRPEEWMERRQAGTP